MVAYCPQLASVPVPETAMTDASTTRPARPLTVHKPSVSGLPPLRPYARDFWQRRPFMWHLARTELKGTHYNTFLGQVWLLLDPLLMAGIYFMLRSVVRPAGSEFDRNRIIAHLIIGVMVYRYTSSSMASGARSITGNSQMVLNTSFPRAIFPVVAVIGGTLEFLPMIVMMLVTQLVLGQPVGPSLLFLPLVFAILAVFNMGLAMLVAPAMVLFRDTSGFLPYISQSWLYASPVLYTIAEIPPNILPYLRWNPLFPTFAALEEIFSGQAPSLSNLVFASLWAILFLVAGTTIFLRTEPDFAARL